MSFALIGARRKIRFSQQEKRGHHAEAERQHPSPINAKAPTWNLFSKYYWGSGSGMRHRVYGEKYINEHRQTKESG
jgi:hypothetical protein